MITSRAIDTAGNIQPAMNVPVIANKKTYRESNGQITSHGHKRSSFSASG
jgi:hypothetical protein